MNASGRTWAAIAASAVLWLLAGGAHARGAACEKENERVSEMRWALVRHEVSEVDFKKALATLARCNASHDLSPRTSGQGEAEDARWGLRVAYVDAIRRAVSKKWILPENLPNTSCVVHLIVVPGGDLISVRVDEACPYDAQGRQSLEQAIWLAQPLPYKGYESIWQRTLDVSFMPERH